MRSCLYRGELSHHRGGSVKNVFAYNVSTFCLDLDELSALDRKLRLFSLEKRNFFALRGRDYSLDAAMTKPSERASSQRSMKARALDLFAQANVATAPVRIELVTQLRAFGWVFNPVSFFVGYDSSEQLVGVIAEINNTYDQTYAYLLDDSNRATSSVVGETGPVARFTTAKQFFVSPFIGDDCSYEWLFPTRKDESKLDIRMRLSRPVGGRFFAARLTGTRRELTDVALFRSVLRFPALPAQIWGRIHLQALRLRALGLQYRRPA